MDPLLWLVRHGALYSARIPGPPVDDRTAELFAVASDVAASGGWMVRSSPRIVMQEQHSDAISALVLTPPYCGVHTASTALTVGASPVLLLYCLTL